MPYVEEQKLEYKALIAGTQMPVVTKKVTIGQDAAVIKAGTVLEIEATSKKAKRADADVYGVALADIDATKGDVVAEIAVTGEFATANLVFKSGKKRKTSQLKLKPATFISVNKEDTWIIFTHLKH